MRFTAADAEETSRRRRVIQLSVSPLPLSSASAAVNCNVSIIHLQIDPLPEQPLIAQPVIEHFRVFARDHLPAARPRPPHRGSG